MHLAAVEGNRDAARALSSPATRIIVLIVRSTYLTSHLPTAEHHNDALDHDYSIAGHSYDWLLSRVIVAGEEEETSAYSYTFCFRSSG